MKRTRRPRPPVWMPSGFTGFRFPPEVILLAVRWYLPVRVVLPGPRRAARRARHRGRPRDPLPVGAAVHAVVDRRRPAVSARGRGSLVRRRDLRQGLRGLALRVSGGRPARPGHRRVRVAASGHRLCPHVLHRCPDRARRPRPRSITDRAPALANVIEDLVPAALHNTGQYENNRVECDHGRLKARLRPMRGLKTESNGERGDPGARVRPEPASWPLRARSRRHAACSGWPPHSTNSDPPSDQRRPQVPPRHGLRSNNATEPALSSWPAPPSSTA